MPLQFPARRTMEPFDVLMYRSEDDPRGRSTLTGVFVLDTAPEWGRLVETWDRASRVILPLRQKVVEPTVPVRLPMWVVDPDFQLSYHLRRARLPEPGDDAQLLEFLGPITQAPLDRARPLWEFTLVEGLAGGRAAWVMKTNHAITDGVGGQEMAQVSFDLEREAGPKEMPPEPDADLLSPDDLVRMAVAGAPARTTAVAATGIASLARFATRALQRPSATAKETADHLQSLRRVMRGPAAQPSPLWRARSLRRQLATLEVGLDELRAASKCAGGSLNDGLLAAVAAGVRMYHDERGAPVESIPIAMPINVRTDSDPTGGNRWAGAQLGLPVAVADPGERIERITTMVRAARRDAAIDVMGLFAPLAARLPMSMLAGAFRDVSRPDLQISNIPGSPVPLYLAGAKVLKTIGFGPVPGPAAMITMYSYVRECFLGINLDTAAITEPDAFVDCLRAGIDEVLTLR